MDIGDKLRFGIFRALTKNQINEINKNHYDVSFKSGETIFKQGNALTHIICITKGKAKVLLEDYHNQTILLKILKQSNIIGGPGFATDYRHYFSVVAIEDTETCFIDVKYFMNLVINNSDFAIDLIAYLNRGFINHYDQLKGISNKYMSGRMADTLLYLSDEVYESKEFNTTLSRSDIANMSFMSRESAIRTLKKFKDDGLIECSSDYFKILKSAELAEIREKG